jgi:hypothetical protein
MTLVMEWEFWGEDLNGWLLSPYIVICLLCMIQIISMGFRYRSPLPVQWGAQGSWMFTQW